MVSDIGASAVILESHHRLLEERAVEYDVPDQTLGLPLGRNVQDRKPFNGLFICLIIFPQELIAAAHCENDAPVFHICLEIFPDVF